MIFILRADKETDNAMAMQTVGGSVKEARITMIRNLESVLRESGLDRKCRTHGPEEGGLPLRPVS